jgi:hypothetical protein
VNHTYLVTASVVDGDGNTIEQFTAYSYPGSIAGKAFGWTSQGLIISCNALFARFSNYEDPTAVPRAVLARALYRATSFDEVLTMLRAVRSVCSFAANVGAIETDGRFRDYGNVEVGTDGAVAVTLLRPPPGSAGYPAPTPSALRPFPGGTAHHYYHANNFLALNTTQYSDASSVFRILRLRSLSVPTTDSDIRARMGDQGNAVWPVYRDGSNGRAVYTMCSVVFDPATRQAHLYLTNPAAATRPNVTLPMWSRPTSPAPTPKHGVGNGVAFFLGVATAIIVGALGVGVFFLLRQRNRHTTLTDDLPTSSMQ